MGWEGWTPVFSSQLTCFQYVLQPWIWLTAYLLSLLSLWTVIEYLGSDWLGQSSRVAADGLGSVCNVGRGSSNVRCRVLISSCLSFFLPHFFTFLTLLVNDHLETALIHLNLTVASCPVSRLTCLDPSSIAHPIGLFWSFTH